MPAWSQSLSMSMFVLATMASSIVKGNNPKENQPSEGSVLICHSLVMLEGWADGPTHGIIQLTGYLQADSSLTKTRITGAYQADQKQTWPLPEDKSELQSFNSYQKVRNSYCWFQPILPVDLSTGLLHHTMMGFLKYACDDVVISSTLELKCFVKGLGYR